jgi:hypothetical protein
MTLLEKYEQAKAEAKRLHREWRKADGESRSEAEIQALLTRYYEAVKISDAAFKTYMESDE